jgi:two-component system, cell cycle sensor histidine kinase and response regulator CckA
VMPHMNGRQLLDQLREQDPKLRVLFMSGYAERAILHEGILGQGLPFLQKPFGVEGLLRSVRAALDG